MIDDTTRKHLQDAIDARDLNAVRAIVNGPVKYVPDAPVDVGRPDAPAAD